MRQCLSLLAPLVLMGSALSSSTPSHHYDFDRLSGLMKRLENLRKEAPETLKGFYEPDLRSFTVVPTDSIEKRMCITSTCYALLTITLSIQYTTGTYDSVLSLESSDDREKGKEEDLIPIPDVVDRLLAAKVREGDLFQVPLVLYTLLSVDALYPKHSLIAQAAKNEETAAKIRKLISIVLKGRPHRSLGRKQENSDYISYQVCKVIGRLQECDFNLLPEDILPEGTQQELFWVLQRSTEVSYNELCRQLAYRTAGDSNSFDVVRLAYSLLTYIRGTESLEGISGKEVSPGQGPAEDTRVAPLNQKLVQAALLAFFEEQNQDGLWDKGQPIYKSFKHGKGRNMDNAFVFAVNTVGSLLCAIPAEEFRPHLKALEKTLAWIESHQTVEIVTTYCDVESGQCYGIPLKGWRSPHHEPDSGPNAWSTAQVLKCVSFLRRTISQLIHNDVLEEFQGSAFSKDGIQPDAWNRLLDSDLGSADGNGEQRTLKAVLEERVVQPFSQSIDNPSYGAAYSAVLFGPPGTAKTTICEALAKRMGYDFCVIDTAAFLADGLSNVSARIRYVFKRLMALRNCVILFDEIEEFCLSREDPGLSMESRMLTTAMLTAINDLRQHRQSLFFVATNRLRAFDSAITRPGRFDMQLFAGPPNLESRVIQLEQQLQSTGVAGAAMSNAIESYRAFLAANWSEEAMFMNFLEGVQFASACAGIVSSGNALTNEAMQAILDQQAAVMTVRGATREEFIASMELSRL